ncbi:MAG: Gfo/Idh/MocA family oxidoreductase [Clostridia bacterium]|nr:Gfo/Idh/MocA family oxidoreductase [Clostridia bacterium]
MSDKKVTVAVIGCGRISEIAHFPALSKMDDVRIKYACDIIPEKAKAKAEKYGAEQVITDYRIALSDPEVDAVYVLTPNYAHYTITMDALKAGKHVFCEKPITVNYPLSLEMAEEAAKAGKILNIGVCNRYHRTVETLEKMNRDGEFGKIYHVYCSFRSYRSIPGLGGPFTTKEQSGGGVLIDWGIHFLDLILYILGGAKLKSVSCEAYSEMAKDIKDYVYRGMWAENTMDPNGINDVEDFITGLIRTDKASVSFNGAWAQNIDKNEMFIDFLGDKAGVRMNYGSDFTLYTVKDGQLTEIKPKYEIPNMYECEDRDFIKSVRTGERNRNYIDNILESAKLLDYLYRSAEQNREISF